MMVQPFLFCTQTDMASELNWRLDVLIEEIDDFDIEQARPLYSFRITINILLASLGSARPFERFITSPTSLMTGFSFPFRIVIATSGKSRITPLQVSSRSPVGEVSRPRSFKILARVASGEGWAMICRIMDFPVVPTSSARGLSPSLPAYRL